MGFENCEELFKGLLIERYTAVWYREVCEDYSGAFGRKRFFCKSQVAGFVLLEHGYDDIDACCSEGEHLVIEKMVAPGSKNNR